MHLELPLAQMSLEEKLQLMETLWDDLSRTPDNIPSPSWHDEVLDECRRVAETGEEAFVDLEAAKAAIRRRVS